MTIVTKQIIGEVNIMMNIIEKIDMLLSEADKKPVKKWSGKVETDWHPKEGTFEGSASSIASYLANNSDSFKQAMSRLNFYINRAGSNLPDERKSVLERAKELLRKRYGKEED